jgi:dipeptidyl aminopeptidase/acylaminoacyl peptidase
MEVLPMKMNGSKKQHIISIILILSFLSLTGLTAQTAVDGETAKRPLTLRDIMKFKRIHDPQISDDGMWVVYNAQPDRGNGEVTVYYTADLTKPFKQIPRGKKPGISKDGKWIAALIAPDAVELEKAGNNNKNKKKNGKEKPKTGLALLDTDSGEITTFDKVKAFAFSENSQWLVMTGYPAKDEIEETGETDNTETKKKKKEDKWAQRAYSLVLRHIPTATDIRIERVIYYGLDPSNRYLGYSIYDADDGGNGLFVRDLQKPGAPVKKIHTEPEAMYTNLAWSKTKSRLAFLFHRKKKKKVQTGFSSGLSVWDGIRKKRFSAVTKEQIPKGWMTPAENKLQWTEDGERLFFGFKPYYEYIQTLVEEKENHKELSTADLFNIDQILEKRKVDVWHWKDPKIIPHQKKQWEKFRKQIYLAVYHFRSNQFIPLCDKVMPDLQIPWNPQVALGTSNRPYLREVTWDGRYRDVFISHLNTGFRKKILTRHQYDVSLSPGGRFAVYYKDKHWYLYNVRLKYARRLTGDIKTPFFNEDHDYPMDVPSYGIAGWTENDRSVIIYDKYDIWEFFAGSDKNKFACLTKGMGRENKLVFRIKKTDPDEKFFKKNQKCLLTAYSDMEKYTAFYSLTLNKNNGGPEKLLEEKKTFTFLKKAKNADKYIYTRESFQEFPDIWISGFDFTAPRKVTDVNPQRKDFLWGTSELVEWEGLDGTPLQGVVIKPENYDSSKRYPVLIYFYRLFSQRLYQFNQVVVNHRPCFPYYAGHGYVIFLPDIRFQVGHPGKSTFQCIVPGVQKLIDMGIADPKAIGIHGHSWSGYQTAFIVTQTNIFAAAIAGAPVSNMTSAYSGIRWGSGMARQFQYEKSQSRIGKNLWENPELYIENSPVFFADRIETPLLIQFGDKDGAVPWYQGIELYLAMRRHDKNCIFLQYNDEPHHLKKYANKVDYTIKMKQFLDHYLKGKPAPDWITKGIPYVKK